MDCDSNIHSLEPTILFVFQPVYHTKGSESFNVWLNNTGTLLNNCYGKYHNNEMNSTECNKYVDINAIKISSLFAQCSLNVDIYNDRKIIKIPDNVTVQQNNCNDICKLKYPIKFYLSMIFLEHRLMGVQSPQFWKLWLERPKTVQRLAFRIMFLKLYSRLPSRANCTVHTVHGKGWRLYGRNKKRKKTQRAKFPNIRPLNKKISRLYNPQLPSRTRPVQYTVHGNGLAIVQNTLRGK